jgi:hypothetical protein
LAIGQRLGGSRDIADTKNKRGSEDGETRFEGGIRGTPREREDRDGVQKSNVWCGWIGWGRGTEFRNEKDVSVVGKNDSASLLVYSETRRDDLTLLGLEGGVVHDD